MPKATKPFKRVLIVDDEELVRRTLGVYLARHGFEAVAAPDVDAAEKELAQQDFDCVLLDVRMPRRSGLELLDLMNARGNPAVVIVMTAYGAADLPVDAIRRGAHDYMTKPFQPEEMLTALRKAEERERLRHEGRPSTPPEVAGAPRPAPGPRPGLVGSSPAMTTLLATIGRVAVYKTSVLITGESGTGKELVARALHERSPRAGKAFVAVNCGAIPATLLESELYGHRRGAFTDAHADRVGLFEQADGGTIFLDEIGELPLPLQVKLLRTLQEGTIRPLGDSVEKQVDVRIVAATVKNLEEEVRAGRFREDLFYRLNVVPLKTPPLRDRREDIPLLVEHFLRLHAAKHGTPVATVGRELMEFLVAYDWPGNVRELENTLERALVLSDQGRIEVSALDEKLRAPRSRLQVLLSQGELSYKRLAAILEEELIKKALAATNGNRTHAARRLEISHRALLYKIKAMGLDGDVDGGDGGGDDGGGGGGGEGEA